jgi:hypothetical protein
MTSDRRAIRLRQGEQLVAGSPVEHAGNDLLGDVRRLRPVGAARLSGTPLAGPLRAVGVAVEPTAGPALVAVTGVASSVSPATVSPATVSEGPLATASFASAIIPRLPLTVTTRTLTVAGITACRVVAASTVASVEGARTIVTSRPPTGLEPTIPVTAVVPAGLTSVAP